MKKTEDIKSEISELGKEIEKLEKAISNHETMSMCIPEEWIIKLSVLKRWQADRQRLEDEIKKLKDNNKWHLKRRKGQNLGEIGKLRETHRIKAVIYERNRQLAEADKEIERLQKQIKEQGSIQPLCSCGMPQSKPVPHEHDRTPREELMAREIERLQKRLEVSR